MNQDVPAVATAPLQPFSLPATIAELTPMQQGWLQMCHIRIHTFSELQKGELAIQGLLNNHAEEKDLAVIQGKIKEARQIFETRKEQRLNFTGLLKQKIIDPAMEFEQRSQTLLNAANNTELALRKAAEADNQRAANIAAEKARFTAHCNNENARIKNAYVNLLQRRITFYYTEALKQKKKNKKELAAYINDIKLELPNIELPAYERFNKILLTKDELQEIFLTIEKYNPKEDLELMIEKVEKDFEMYEQDIKNAEAAIASTVQQQQQQESEAEQALEIETATNLLVATADNINFTGGPFVKRKKAIVVENTPECALAILTAFIPNMGKCKLKVKEWGNLKISQIAAALSELDKEFPNLVYKEIEK